MSWFFWWGSLIFLFVLWGVLTLVLFFVDQGFEGTLVCFVLAICSSVVLAFIVIYRNDREVHNSDIFPWLFLVTIFCAFPFIAVVEPFG